VVFDDGALRAVHRLTTGLPRRINIVCDRALLGAYAARSRRVTAGIVKRAAHEVAGKREGDAMVRRRRRKAVALVLIVLLLAAASALAATGSIMRWIGAA
jgi:general secretion pathway protein A